MIGGGHVRQAQQSLWRNAKNKKRLMKKAVRRGYDCGQGQSAIEIGNIEFGNLFLNYGWWTVILAF